MIPQRRRLLTAGAIAAVGLAALALMWLRGARASAVIAALVFLVVIVLAMRRMSGRSPRQGADPARGGDETAAGASSDGAPQDPARAGPVARVARNDPCPCGSGLKYKQCCGAG